MITMQKGHGIKKGDILETTPPAGRPWWLRLWHWIIRKKFRFVVTEATSTTITTKDL